MLDEQQLRDYILSSQHQNSKDKKTQQRLSQQSYKTQLLLALGALNPNMTRGNGDDDRELESKTTGLRDHAVVADGVYNPQPPPLCHVTCSDYAIFTLIVPI